MLMNKNNFLRIVKIYLFYFSRASRIFLQNYRVDFDYILLIGEMSKCNLNWCVNFCQ